MLDLQTQHVGDAEARGQFLLCMKWHAPAAPSQVSTAAWIGPASRL